MPPVSFLWRSPFFPCQGDVQLWAGAWSDFPAAYPSRNWTLGTWGGLRGAATAQPCTSQGRVMCHLPGPAWPSWEGRDRLQREDRQRQTHTERKWGKMRQREGMKERTVERQKDGGDTEGWWRHRQSGRQEVLERETERNRARQQAMKRGTRRKTEAGPNSRKIEPVLRPQSGHVPTSNPCF